ncbi:MAG: GTPase ObgE [Acidimicrobiia bacterium]|nr:GTPase ObgE [Acidimicrobiia bacterium]
MSGPPAVFVDRVRLTARGGAGGAGVASFRKQRGKPRGRPEGGSGGGGGDVILEASDSLSTLLHVARHPVQAAGDGTHGEGDLRHGARGADLMIPVPLGTVITDAAGTMLADLVESGQRITLASGGRGGRGNAAFVNERRRAPSFAEQGEFGTEAEVWLELKLVADAALIGFPNAGKSTLISAVSAARPKVADYPFTTLEPHLGMVEVNDRVFVLADIPGLIEGAAEGKGLGHEFLRHAERARVLVVLLDPSPLQEMSPLEQHRVLIGELEQHSPELADRPRLVAVNKADLAGASSPAPDGALSISAITGDGTIDLMHAIADAVEGQRRDAPERPGFILHRPIPAAFSVESDGDTWVVSGRAAERAINLADLTVAEAADFVASRLSRIGVDDALREAGAQPGDDVRIGDLVFTFEPFHEEEE